MNINSNITTSGQLKLTQGEINYLQQFLKANDRGGYYLALYNMTGVTQVLVQGEISTFSESGGGAAYVSNMLMYEYKADYKVKLKAYLDNPENGYLGKPVTLDTFSNIIAKTDLDNMDLYRQDGNKDNKYPLENDSTGYFDNGLMLQKAFEAWEKVDLLDYFPGQSLTAAEQSVLYVKEVIEKINHQYEGVIPSVLEALKSVIQVYVNEFQNQEFDAEKFLNALKATGTGYAVLGVLLGSRFLAKKLSDFEDREGYKIVDLPDAKYKVVIDIKSGFVAGMFRDEFVPDTLPSVLTTVAEYWPEVVGLLTGGLSGVLSATIFAGILEEVGELYKESVMFQPGEYSGMPTRWSDLLSEYAEIGTENNETLWGTGGENSAAITDIIHGDGGDDRIFSGDGADQIYGAAGDDLLYGQKGADDLYGGGGKDTLRGGQGSDHLYGGKDDDYLDGGDITDAESGDDFLIGGKGKDVLVGASGSDFLYGDNEIAGSEEGDGDDELYGGDGVDYLTGGGGNDYLEGGKGDDNYYFNGDWGNDIIRDIDGKIIINGVYITQGNKINERVYEDQTGGFLISKVKDSDGNIQILIFKKNDTKNTIIIKDWKELDIGFDFKLDDNDSSKEVNTTGLGLNGVHDEIFTISKYLWNGNYIIGTNTPVSTNKEIDNNTDYSKEMVYIHTKGGNDFVSLQDSRSYLVDVSEYNKVSQNTVITGNGNNIILGAIGSDRIITGSGNDFIEVDDEIYAEKTSDGRLNGFNQDGNGQLIANWGNYVESGAGKDRVYGGYGVDTIYAGADQDLLFGGGESDILSGDDGADVIYGDKIIIQQFNSLNNRKDVDRSIFDEEMAINPYLYNRSFNISSNSLETSHELLNLGHINFSDQGGDFIFGGKGNDVIFGEGGGDEVYGGEDNDIISGDSNYVYQIFETVNIYNEENNYSGAEVKFLDNYNLNREFYDNLKDKYKYEFSGNDRIFGDSGDDKIFGGYKNDELDGGDGNDEIYGDSDIFSNLNLFKYLQNYQGKIWGTGASSDDFLYSIFEWSTGVNLNERLKVYALLENLNLTYEANDLIKGGDGADKIFGEEGNDYIQGDGGNDYLVGDSNANSLPAKYHGDDDIFGGDGDDIIFGAGGSDQLYGGSGDDQIQGDSVELAIEFHKNDWIEGGNGSDNIWGQGGDDNILGNEGNDYIYGGFGNDKLFGGDGKDYIVGDEKDNRTGDGDDELYGGNGNDTLIGYDGNDILDGGGDDDLIFAGKGDDIIYSNSGNDQLAGGDGNDEYHINARWNEVKVIDGMGENHIYLDGSVDISKIRIYEYTNAVSLMLSLPKEDTGELFQEFKKFTLTFFDNSESISLSDGSGILKDEYGNNLRGGYNQYLHFNSSGNGQYRINSTTENIIHLETFLKEQVGLSFKLWQGTWAGITGSFNIFSNSIIENDKLIYEGANIGDVIDINKIRSNVDGHGNFQADEYHLKNGDDIANGSVLSDVVYGGQGNDEINGLEGDDSLFGGDGEDTLKGGEGNDSLYGGKGNNLLYGGGGVDQYFIDFESGNDIVDDVDGVVLNLIDINSDEFKYNYSGDDLLIYKKNNDYLKIKNYLKDFNISKIVFDNEQWDSDYVKEKTIIIKHGTADSDTLNSIPNFINKLSGGDGDDVLSGANYQDFLYGGTGNDILSTHSKSGSILNGGLGYDRYYISEAANVKIDDEDFDAKIYLSGKHSYFNFDGKYISESPDRSSAEVIYANDLNLTYTYKYSLNNLSLLSIKYIAETGGLSFSKGDELYFSLSNIYDLNDTSNINFEVGAYSYSIWNPNNGGTSTINYLSSQFTMKQFVSVVREVVQEYTSDDDVILGVTLLGEDIIYANGGNDHIYTGLGKSLVYAEDGNDYIIATDTNALDRIYGGIGDDTIYNYDPTNENPTISNNFYQRDKLYGGEGNDTIYVKYQFAEVYGGEGNDTLTGYGELYGGSGNDTLLAGDGGSYLDGGEGADHLIGGSGDDTFIVDEFDTYEENNPSGGYDTLYIAQSIDLGSGYFEAVTLQGDQNFNIHGNAANNRLIGNVGNNYIDGRTGSDYMAGGAGDDYYVIDITDSIGIDEDGNSVILDGDQVVEDFNAGIDTVERWQDSRFISQDGNGDPILTNNHRLLDDNIENLILKGNAKTAFGNDLDNIIVGNSQDNYIDGLSGNDTYVFARGGGTDTYSFEDSIDSINILKIQGYAFNDVSAQKYGNSVYLSFKGTNDHIWLSNYYVADTQDMTYRMDQIIFDSGTTWTSNDIDILINRAQSNHAPTVNAVIPLITSNQGALFSYKFASNVIIDQDSWDALSYKITLTTKGSNGQYLPIPSWLNFDAATQTLSGTPPSNVTGNLSFFYWGTDMYGLGTATSFNLKVNLPNQAPTVLNAIADQSVTEAKAFNYTVPSTAFKDPDGDALTYTATLEDGSPLPIWLTFNASTRVLSGTSPDNTAPLNIKITVKDTANQSVSDVFKLTFAVQNLTINGTSSADTLYGASGNDSITGQAGNDILYGQSGNDTLNGGTGNDTMYGGKGDDIYVVDSTTDIVSENANEGIDIVQSSVTYILGSDVENLTLTGTIAINGTGNVLNNTILGNSAINTLTGGLGDDYLDGGAGADKLLGGVGNDTYVIDNTSDMITENANEGTDTVRSSVTLTLGNNLENLTLTGTTAINGTGSAFNNTIIGNSAVNTLTGGAGDDYLDGGAGADKLLGGVGNDTYVIDNTSDTITENSNEGTDTILSSITLTLGSNLENLILTGSTAINATGNTLNNMLTGNSGANVLNGGTGNDILDGQGGNDQFTGGIGSDTIVYQLLVVSDAVGGNGNDSWSDFTVGNTTTNVNADKIDISDLLVDYTGNYNFSSLDPFIKTIVSGSNTQFYIDRDGGGSTYSSSLLLTLNNVNTNLNDLINNQQIMI